MALFDASVRPEAFGNCCFITGCDSLYNHEVRLKKIKDKEKGLCLFVLFFFTTFLQ